MVALLTSVLCSSTAFAMVTTVLGKQEEIGRVRAGHLADVIVVNGNPLSNLRLLYPTGADVNVDGKPVHAGGVEWTIKDGIPYHGPTLLERVRVGVAMMFIESQPCFA